MNDFWSGTFVGAAGLLVFAIFATAVFVLFVGPKLAAQQQAEKRMRQQEKHLLEDFWYFAGGVHTILDVAIEKNIIGKQQYPGTEIWRLEVVPVFLDLQCKILLNYNDAIEMNSGRVTDYQTNIILVIDVVYGNPTRGKLQKLTDGSKKEYDEVLPLALEIWEFVSDWTPPRVG